MNRRVLVSGACVCLAGLVALALAQEPPRVVEEGTGRPAIVAQPVPAPPTFPRTTVVPERTPNNAVQYYQDPYVQLEQDPPVNELLGKWKAAGNESERGKVEKELRQVLKEQFQGRLGAHEKEIEQLEAKVKQLREQLDLRRKKQDEIVDFRAQQLLREAQGLGWGTEPATGQVRSIKGRYDPPQQPSFEPGRVPGRVNQATQPPPVPVPPVPLAEPPTGADSPASDVPADKPASPPRATTPPSP